MTEKSVPWTATIKQLLIGYCLGTANIIPGVSGGTFLLIFKIYERVFDIVNRINKANLLQALRLLSDMAVKPGRRSMMAFSAFLAENDFVFLIKLLIGSIVAIVSLSSLMKYLIVAHFEVTYALFFGLILVSVIIPVQMLEHKRPWLLFFAAAGCLATIWISASVNPYDKVLVKSRVNQAAFERQQMKLNAAQNTSPNRSRFLAYIGKYSINEYLYAGLSGAASISAMVLPGVSGSLVLILMGQYFEVVSAISALKTLNLDAILFLSCFSIGLVFGGLVFARLIRLVLKVYYNATMAFLTGLMVGSLYALWPFKAVIVMPEQYIKQDGMIRVIENVTIYTNTNVGIPDSALAIGSLAAFGLGCVIMSFFIKAPER